MVIATSWEQSISLLNHSFVHAQRNYLYFTLVVVIVILNGPPVHGSLRDHGRLMAESEFISKITGINNLHPSCAKINIMRRPSSDE